MLSCKTSTTRSCTLPPRRTQRCSAAKQAQHDHVRSHHGGRSDAQLQNKHNTIMYAPTTEDAAMLSCKTSTTRSCTLPPRRTQPCSAASSVVGAYMIVLCLFC